MQDLEIYFSMNLRIQEKNLVLFRGFCCYFRSPEPGQKERGTPPSTDKFLVDDGKLPKVLPKYVLPEKKIKADKNTFQVLENTKQIKKKT